MSVGRILDTDVSASKSPKRQSLSVYERVKSKVSRSLSNGSVIHKKYTQPRRPSSLLLHPTDTISNLVHVWSCARCTLYNSGETSRCEVSLVGVTRYIYFSESVIYVRFIPSI